MQGLTKIFGALTVGVVALLSGCASDPQDLEDFSGNVEEEVIVEPAMRYGIPEESFKIIEGTIKPNEFLADILLPFHVSYTQIAELEGAAKDVHDLRKLRAGDDYAIFCNKDSLGAACYFVVETSMEDYVVYQLSDSISARIAKKPVQYEMRSSGGVIESSLYQTIADNDLSPELAMRLSDIYAWTVDFYRIQKGDHFKVVFEEKYVDGQKAGVGRILAAEFSHRGETYRGFRFESDDEGLGYFDETGESLRKAFLKSPLKFSRISSRYTLKRYHPVQKRWKAHLGTDYAAPTGTEIMSTADGTVIASEYGKYNGHYVKVQHNSTYTTQYLHMSKRAVKKGDRVRQGQIIGYVGSTGLASGPHVCYRFWKNGKQVDPDKQELPRSEPIHPEYKTEFDAARDSLSIALDQIEFQGEKMAFQP